MGIAPVRVLAFGFRADRSAAAPHIGSRWPRNIAQRIPRANAAALQFPAERAASCELPLARCVISTPRARNTCLMSATCEMQL